MPQSPKTKEWRQKIPILSSASIMTKNMGVGEGVAQVRGLWRSLYIYGVFTYIDYLKSVFFYSLRKLTGGGFLNIIVLKSDLAVTFPENLQLRGL